MTYPPAGFPPPSGPYSTPDPFQGTPFPANPNPFQQAGPPPAARARSGKKRGRLPFSRRDTDRRLRLRNRREVTSGGW